MNLSSVTFILFVCMLLSACNSGVGEPQLKPLDTIKEIPLTTTSLKANFCSPDSKTSEVNSLIIVIMDDSASNGRRAGGSIIGTDVGFIPIEEKKPNELNLEYYLDLQKVNNQRYVGLGQLLAAQDDSKHAYAMIQFSDIAEVLSNEGIPFFAKNERSKFIEKLNQLSNATPEGATNYIDALRKLGDPTERIIESYLSSLPEVGTEGNESNVPLYISTYFITDGDPIVVDASGKQVRQSYADINKLVYDFINKKKYLVNNKDIHFNRMVKTFNTIFYNFPSFKTTFTGELEEKNGKYVIDPNAYSNTQELESNLRNLANVFGAGNFFKLDGKIDFSKIGIGNITTKYRLLDPWVYNLNAAWFFDSKIKLAKYEADSDADGIADLFEKRIGCNPNNPDTNGDGIRDGIQIYLSDPTTTCSGTMVINSSVSSCSEEEKNEDQDKDGLTDCEERILGTKNNGADENNNRIPDLIEALNGLSLKSDQSLGDFDNDGILNYMEIYLNTPLNFDNSKYVQNLDPHEMKVTFTNSSQEKVCKSVSINNFKIASGETTPNIYFWFQAQDLTETSLRQFQLKKDLGKKSLIFNSSDFEEIR